ncbi:short chain dehydrogenase reductase [Xylogone sp. PMI_703]|nr:short chain dehydrogenase reductase [Xylogone sp. PMI_703]
MPNFGPDTTAEEVATVLKDRITGKNVLITGCSQDGLGAEAARVIALHKPALIVLAGRSIPKCEETANLLKLQSPEIITRILQIDLASRASVRKAAAEVISYNESIDILINNAAVMAVPALTKTIDGIECQFGINYIGHFLFTNLIMPKILTSGRGARVINISSKGYLHGKVRFNDPNFEKQQYQKWQAYGQSKTAIILFSKALAKKLGPKGIFSYSVDPGAIASTNLKRDITEADFGFLPNYYKVNKFPDTKLITLEQGAATYVAAAFDPSLESHNGELLTLFQPTTLEAGINWFHEENDTKRLWAMSEDIVGQKFEY